MAKYYVQRITNESRTTVNDNVAAADKSILTDGARVGIYNKGASAYNGTTLMNSNLPNTTLTRLPNRDTIGNLIKTKIDMKNAFDKFFSNTTGDAHNTSSTASGQGQVWNNANTKNLNAFAYMRANLGPFA